MRLSAAPTSKAANDDGRLVTLEALRALSEVDLLYADLYLHRAQLLLPALCARNDYLHLRCERDELPRVVDELRHATKRGDWSRVRLLADDAAGKKTRLAARQRVLEVADAVYGPRVLHAGPTALALNGVVSHPTAALERERSAVVDHLRLLATEDDDWADLYKSRAAHFGRLEVVADEQAGASVDAEGLRKRILTAVERADFDEVRRLTEAVVDERGKLGRTRVPVPSDGRANVLSTPFPDGALARGRDLGLTAETLPTAASLNAYLGCCCADRTTFPAAPLSDAHRRPDTCTCGHACPPDVRQTFRESLDLVLLHPFMSSAGTRYLPWFGAETLLIEAFPETDPEARTPVLDRLGLSQRRGVPRLAIEDALRSHAVPLCEDLGVDPIEFTVACVPFDAYTRLAPQHGWGREQLWTHFDGYQVTRELRLHALVGGDVRYGGADDFCAVQRDYDAPRITARFCVLRRERFLARHQPESDSGGAPQ